ncbi:MAG: FAD-dependent oxidoreductase, partial [Pseudomonadota bacterium]
EEAETDALSDLARRAWANGVDDLEEISGQAAREIEPELACVAALHSPSTGIVDSHALMLSLLGEAEAAGAMLALATEVTAVEPGFLLTTGGEAPMQLRAREVVNAGGHGAPGLSAALTGAPPRGYLAKGCYFTLSGRAPFERLIYPAPVPGGLGTHLTLDLAGQARFGPDVEWVDEFDYEVDPARGEKFYADIRRYWPGLPEGSLAPGYSGIRPKIVPKGAPAGDFRIESHGIPGYCALYGIESPGLTACLALAGAVTEMLQCPR